MPLLVHTVMQGEEACSILSTDVMEAKGVLLEPAAEARAAQALTRSAPVRARQHRVVPEALA